MSGDSTGRPRFRRCPGAADRVAEAGWQACPDATLPVMTTSGADYAWSHPTIAAMQDAGVHFVSRYLSWDSPRSVGKNFNAAAERDSLLGNGIDIILNWEYDARDSLRGAAGGTTDGTEARRQAKFSGYPFGAFLPSSMDWDVTPAQKPTCLAYARTFSAACPEYQYGPYGGYWIVKYLLDAGAAGDAWQAYAWSGGLWDPRPSFRQVKNGVKIGGADTDLDIMVKPARTWLHPGTPLGPAPTPIAAPAPAQYVHGSEGDESVPKILVMNGAQGAVFVGEVGGASCRWVQSPESLDNLRWWMSKTGASQAEMTVNVFEKGKYKDVIGECVGTLPPAQYL